MLAAQMAEQKGLGIFFLQCEYSTMPLLYHVMLNINNFCEEGRQRLPGKYKTGHLCKCHSLATLVW